MKSHNVVLSALVAFTLLSVTTAFAQAPAAVVAPKAAAVTAAPAAPAAAAAAAPAAASKDAPVAKTEKKAAAKPAKPFVAKTAKSKECSAKADEQKLHGKARKEFREQCKKAA